MISIRDILNLPSLNNTLRHFQYSLHALRNFTYSKYDPNLNNSSETIFIDKNIFDYNSQYTYS